MAQTDNNDAQTEAATANDEAKTDATEALGDAGKKALDAERSSRKAAEKALADAQARLQEIEDASKSELELATERAKRFEDSYNDLVRTSLRNEVALTKGLTPAQAKRLVGDTREALEADADELLATFAAATTAAGDTPPAKPGLLRASGGNPDPAQSERDALASALFGR